MKGFVVFIFNLAFFAGVLFAIASGAAPRANVVGLSPDIGLNLLSLFQNSNRGNQSYAEDRNGLSLQEAELQFSSDVDPYWRLVATFSMHQEVEVDTSSEPPSRNAHYVFEPEEAFAETLSLPHFNVRVGKMKAAFGKHNPLHTHAYTFVDAPIVHKYLFGEEGLNDVGASISSMLPVSWFSEMTLQGLSGQAENLSYFHSPSANSSVGVLRFVNLVDVGEQTTAELGLSGSSGENEMSKLTQFHGADFTLKWRGDSSHALVWSTEYLERRRELEASESAKGWVTSLQWQFSRIWWAQWRAEGFNIHDQVVAESGSLIPESQRKQSILVGFMPTEFSAIRLQYSRLDDGQEKSDDKILLQLNYSIGAHPAHSY